MTFKEFRKLGQIDQEFVLWSKGVEVATRHGRMYSYLLYQLDSFYIEVRYNFRFNMIDKVTGFDDMEKLAPYLETVNIDQFY